MSRSTAVNRMRKEDYRGPLETWKKIKTFSGI